MRTRQKNRLTIWFAAGIWLLLPYAALAATTISVDQSGGAITTIQAGINAALNGDVVVIADGTYVGPGNVNLDFGGRKITVRSANGPAAVIIDCEDQPNTRGVLFNSAAEDSNTVLEGVTITRGSYDFGAGMRIENGASPTIRNVRLVDNHSSTAAGNNGGGGVSVADSGSNPTFEDCTISNNTTGNTSGSGGGGIRVTNQADVTIINSVIDGNSAAAGINNIGEGGGIFVSNASVTLVGSTISDNEVGYVGGGITVKGGASTSVSIVGSWIFGNYAGFKGGGIRFDSIDPANTVEAINTLFYDNDAGQDGAAVDSYRASPVFTNVTMSGNLSGVPVVNLHTAGSPASTLPTIVTFVNSILWGNSDPVISTQADINTDGNSSLFIDYSDIQNGASWNAFAAGAGNIDTDPQFEDPASDNYQLQITSPVIDAGDNTAVPVDFLDLDNDTDMAEAIPFDLNGDDRFFDIAGVTDTGNGSAPVVDMGAFEESVVTSGGTNPGSGGSSGSGGGGGGGGGCFIQSAASDTQISVWPIAMLLTGIIGMGWFFGQRRNA